LFVVRCFPEKQNEKHKIERETTLKKKKLETLNYFLLLFFHGVTRARTKAPKSSRREREREREINRRHHEGSRRRNAVSADADVRVFSVFFFVVGISAEEE